MATPTYMVTGYLSMINARNVLEETTSGMLNDRPNTINQILPLEAPASARILSVDMFRSATTIEPMARHSSPGETDARSCALASRKTFTAIQTTNADRKSVVQGKRGDLAGR